MAQINGQLTTCERCGAQVFRKCVGEGETDGGYTRWSTFEPYPEGWDIVGVPKSAGLSFNNMRVCPKCHALWDSVINEGFLRGTPYYYIEEASP